MLVQAVRCAVGRRVATLAVLGAIASAGTAAGASSPPLTFTAVSAGGGHTCVITGGGGVKCWGSNRFGQLGNGAKRKCNSFGRCAQPFSSAPVDVVGLRSGVRAIAAGGSHTCAITSRGGVKCWGYNASGQLGNGARLRDCSLVSCEKYASTIPVDVVGLGSGVRAIAVGDFQSCAITAAGGVKCWGSNTDGQLGNDSGHASSTPVDVIGLGAGVKEIAAGAHNTCAVTADGGAKCWGSTPAAVPGLANGVTAIALADGTSAGTGGEHACALTNAGEVKCWGENFAGQLGTGSSTTRSATPVDVVGLGSGIRAISAGADFSCAATDRGGAKCWGGNGVGTLGNGATTKSGTPVGVAGLTSGVTAITAGPYHACAIVSGSGIECWGFNQSGRLGNASAPRIARKPVDVIFATQAAGKPHAAPAAGSTAGRCSKAEATAVVKRLHLGNADDPDVSEPVAQVLCGAFVGPGSQAMVASLAIPSCGRTAGWVVFRRAGGTWQIVMERNNGADLDAGGTGIRETQFVLRPSDAHCFPTGGTRSRTWRWNGTRFVSGAWKYSRPATPTPPTASASTYGFFETPSGNILCGYSHRAANTNVECVVKSGLVPQPAPRRPGCSPPLTVALRETGRAFVTDETCPGEDAPETPYVGSGIAKVLPYGTTWSSGGVRCTSASTGLTCRNGNGHGFFLSRESWRSF